ncbi:hypothetical protein C1X53_02020 [Pseudomonas sp. GW456-E6]|nr:hypothetical protein C1X53_02020 [Pseudomonas sp. GW456-E6]
MRPGWLSLVPANTLLWRGSLLPLGCEAAPKPATQLHQANSSDRNGSAAHSSGSKLPRHR